MDWINTTLKDAERLPIPGLLLKPESKQPLSRYWVDKYSLSKEGLDLKTIERLYKALYVYSIGFNDLMKVITSKAKNHFKTAGEIWRVFCILLEFSWKSDHDMVLLTVHEDCNNAINEAKEKVRNTIESKNKKKHKIMYF